MAFKASPSSQPQHCTDEAQKAETVLSCGPVTFSLSFFADRDAGGRRISQECGTPFPIKCLSENRSRRDATKLVADSQA